MYICVWVMFEYVDFVESLIYIFKPDIYIVYDYQTIEWYESNEWKLKKISEGKKLDMNLGLYSNFIFLKNFRIF